MEILSHNIYLFSATCFYIGNKLCITNKHFFYEDNKLQSSICRIRNKFGDFQANLVLLSENEIDIAIVQIIDEKFFLMDKLIENQLKLSKNSVKKRDIVYCVNYGLFIKEVMENPIVSV